MNADFERNRRAWDGWSDEYQARHGAQLAAHPEAWGVWSLPERELQLLGDVVGLDVLEYGCGGAQWSVALARRGARVTGLDNSARQLDHARAAVAAAGLEVRLVHAAAEHTPFADASFDIVFCDHGAMTFAAPEQTIPEVARILRPGGRLAFSLEHPLHAACWDDAADAPSATLHHRISSSAGWTIPGTAACRSCGPSRRTSNCCWRTGSRWSDCSNRGRRPRRRAAMAIS